MPNNLEADKKPASKGLEKTKRARKSSARTVDRSVKEEVLLTSDLARKPSDIIRDAFDAALEAAKTSRFDNKEIDALFEKKITSVDLFDTAIEDLEKEIREKKLLLEERISVLDDRIQRISEGFQKTTVSSEAISDIIPHTNNNKAQHSSTEAPDELKDNTDNITVVFEGSIDRTAMASIMRKAYEDSGLSQRKFAEKLGLRLNEVQRILNEEASIEASIEALERAGITFETKAIRLES